MAHATGGKESVMSFPASLTRDDMQAFDTFDLLPLRQAVSVSREMAIRFGGQGLLDRLSRPDRFRILRHGKGGQILARNGLALAEAQLVLRHAYGRSIVFGKPAAHTAIDHATGTILEPVMLLRINAPRAYRKALLQLLAERKAEPGEIYVQRDRIVVRTEAPLASLIGLERKVQDHTDGAAHIRCSLVRYSAARGGSA
jgi:hypothetical protein